MVKLMRFASLLLAVCLVAGAEAGLVNVYVSCVGAPGPCATLVDAVTTANPGDTLLLHPGTYVVPSLSSDTPALSFIGAGPPEAVVLESAPGMSALQLGIADALLQNVTVIGGMTVTKATTLDNVLVNSTAYSNRNAIGIRAATLTTVNAVWVYSGTPTDEALSGSAIMLDQGASLDAQGPLYLTSFGAGNAGIYHVGSAGGSVTSDSPIEINSDGVGLQLVSSDITLSGLLLINAGSTGIFASSSSSFTAVGAVNITSQGASTIVGTNDCEFEFQGPLDIVNAVGQDFELASSSVVLAYAMYEAEVNCDATSNITLAEPFTGSAACVLMLPVIEFEETTIAIPANTRQQGLAVLRPTQPLNTSLLLNLYSSVSSYESCDIAPGYPTCIRVLNVGESVELNPVMSSYLVGNKNIATAVYAQPQPSPSAPVLVSDQSSSVPIMLKINATAPVFSLSPSDREQTRREVKFAVGNVQEIDSFDQSVVRTSNIQNSGQWRADSNSTASSEAFQAFRFTTGLFASSGLLEMEMLLFDRNTSLVYGPPASNLTASSNYTITVDQSLAKLSLWVSDWPWRDSSSTKLRVKIVIHPPFKEALVRADTPQANMTTLELIGQGDASANVTTTVRLVDFAFVDGRSDRTVPVSFSINVSDSTLTLEFPYFASSLYYDPDLGLLVRGDDSGGGDSNLALIVAVSVVVPVAVGLVVAVIVAALVVTWWQRRKSAATLTSVNFGPTAGNEDHIL